MVANPLKVRLDLRRYRILVTYPGWNYFLSTIISTRSYEPGLEACLRLLSYAENHRENIGGKEYEEHLQRLLLGVLTMLDKLDRWEEYISVWESLRANTSFVFQQPRRPQSFDMERFTLRDEGSCIYVHFLWFAARRKEVIERKLARKRAGKKLGNLVHSQQDELSQAQIRDRWEQVKERIRYAERMSELVRNARNYQRTET